MAVILDEAALEGLVRHYKGQPAYVFDVETIGEHRVNPLRGDVMWISFACADRSDTIPMGHPRGTLLERIPVLSSKGREREARGVPRDKMNPLYDFTKKTEPVWGEGPPLQLDRGYVFQQLEPLFSSDALKVGHNIRFDLHCVARYLGFYPPGPYYDTLVASWVLDASRSGRGKLTLKECVESELGVVMEKEVGKDINEHSFEDVARYSLLDSDYTWRLYKALEEQFTDRPRERNVLGLEMEVLHTILEMESVGVRIHEERLSEIGESLLREMDTLKGELMRQAGGPFNLNSNRDKQEILFTSKKNGGFGLRPLKRTESSLKRNPSTSDSVYDWSVDRETLLQYENHPFVANLLAHTAKAKLHSTYVLPYIGGSTTRNGKQETVARQMRNGRIHGSFLQFGTESGRMSSREPNLQNIPARTEDGKRLRTVFVADPGHVLVVADYSQIEPRIIAALARDQMMIRTYKDGGDVYEAVADRMGVSRGTGKELVLSIAYGVGPARIAGRIGCSVGEARDLLDYFASKFTAIPRHKSHVVGQAKKLRYSETILGRRRPLPYINKGSDEIRAMSRRQAYNHLIQGSAADIMKIALVNIHASLPDEAAMLLTVHDEVVVQCPENIREEVEKIVREEMEGAAPGIITVPLVADVSHGYSWGEAKHA